MSTEVFLGDPYATREAAVQKMLDMIGRDTSDLTFTPSGGTPGADIPFSDPDVALAWNALAEVYAQTMTRFWYFNTIHDITVSESSGQYLVPDQFGQDDAAHGNTTSGPSAVKVLEQPAELDLIYRRETGTAPEALFDRKTNTNTGFAGKGDIKLEVAYFLLWDVIPFPARQFMVLEAATRFAKRATASKAVVDLIQDDATRARILLTGLDLEQRPPNMLRDGALVLPGITDRFPF